MVQVKVLKNNPAHKKIELRKDTPSTTVRHIEDNTPNTESIHQEEVKVSFVMRGFNKEASNIEAMIHSKKPLNGIPGGKAQGKAPADYPPDMLRKGIKIEREHTPSNKRALEISMDHETEFKDYYKKLPAFERTLKKAASLNDLYLSKHALFPEMGEMVTHGKGLLSRGGKAIKESFKAAPKPTVQETFGGKPWYEFAGHNNPILQKNQEEFRNFLKGRPKSYSPIVKTAETFPEAVKIISDKTKQTPEYKYRRLRSGLIGASIGGLGAAAHGYKGKKAIPGLIGAAVGGAGGVLHNRAVHDLATKAYLSGVVRERTRRNSGSI